MVDLAVSGPAQRPPRWQAGFGRGGQMRWLGSALVCLFFLVALSAPLLAPHDPIEQDLLSAQLPPAWMQGGEATFPLGTDSRCRCVLSRLMYAARTAVAGALIAASLAAVIGIAFGLIAGMFGS